MEKTEIKNSFGSLKWEDGRQKIEVWILNFYI
jgi:hypothetical protein